LPDVYFMLFIFLPYAYAPVIFLYKLCVYVNFLQSHVKLVLLNKVDLPFVKWLLLHVSLYSALDHLELPQYL
jgi:hypothetical protein